MSKLDELLSFTDAIVDEWAFTSQEKVYADKKAAAVAERDDLQRKAALYDQTFIPAGEWDYCNTHDRVFVEKEGCPWCEIQRLQTKG